jgi:hypothetical protein
MSCAKCHQAAPEPGDTWCTACCAWESLGSELCSPWHSRALRHVATDQVESLVRSVRALRNLSSSLKSAETSRAAEKERSGASRSQAARPVLPPPPPPPVKDSVKEQPESSSGSESPSAEEGGNEAAATAAKSKAKKPSREREEPEKEEATKSPARPVSPDRPHQAAPD